MPAPVTPSAVQATRATTIAAIASAAQRTGVDFHYLLGQANVESGLDAKATAKTSSATGLFQFTRQTWLATLKQHGIAHGYGWAAEAISYDANGHYRIADPRLRDAIFDLRKNAHAASDMAAEFAADNAEFLTSRTGTRPEPVDLYLAHFLGAGGAARFLAAYAENPAASAAPLFPAAAAANRSIFYDASGGARSFADIRGRFAAKLDQPNAAQPLPAPSAPFRDGLSPAISASIDGKQSDRPSLALGAIEAMPKRLSLDFAAQSYRRLAAIADGRG